jgi:hypothetical protein
MTHYALFEPLTGKIIRSGSSPTAAMAQLNAQPGLEMLLDCGDQVRPDRHYIVDGAVLEVPARPSKAHRFDYASKSWQVDVNKIISTKRAEIEAHREATIYAPVIVYDGVNLDADATSQRNITEKLNDIARREQENTPMPAQMLVWRDADNVMHTFADQAAMRSWLNGLAIAVGARGAQAYAWSWEKKSQLEAITDPAELAAFDPAA